MDGLLKIRAQVAGFHPEEIPFTEFTFPDGQPHIRVQLLDTMATYTVTASIRSPAELFRVMLVADVLKDGLNRVDLEVTYLMGGRMDKRIDAMSPVTIKAVANAINSCSFDLVTLLDPHSYVSSSLIQRACEVYPSLAVSQAIEDHEEPIFIVVPDKGAVPRVSKILGSMEPPIAKHPTLTEEGWTVDGKKIKGIIYADKVRDLATGRIQSIEILSPAWAEDNYLLKMLRESICLILDDICDGGATFRLLSDELKKYGVKQVDLFVTHGIFSKGFNIQGIKQIYTTDSFAPNQGVKAVYSAEAEFRYDKWA